MAVALYTAFQSTSLSDQCRCHQLAPLLFQIQSQLLIETFWGSCCPPLSVHTHGNPIHRVLVLFHVIRQLCSLQCSCHLNFVPLHGWSSATVPRFARSSLRLLIYAEGSHMDRYPSDHTSAISQYFLRQNLFLHHFYQLQSTC